MDALSQFEEFLRWIAHLPPAVQLEHMLGFLTTHAASWPSETVADLRDYFAAKGTPDATTLAEVLAGHLALWDLNE